MSWIHKHERMPGKSEVDENECVWVWDGFQAIIFPAGKLFATTNYELWLPRCANHKPQAPGMQ
jgi:hypothetical protein